MQPARPRPGRNASSPVTSTLLRPAPATRMRAAAVTLAVVLASLGTTSHASFNAETLSSVIEASFRCRSKTNPGLAVAVVKGGKTLLSRGYGFTDAHGTTRVTGATRFNVASLTKSVTAALMLKIMDETGRYNLSSRVKDILGPKFRFADDLRTEYATVEDLLAHKMAIPPNSRMRFDSKLDRKTIIDRVRHLKSFDTFRSTYIYSNIMYGLASSMTELMGKDRWEELVKKHLLVPLAMKRSTFTTEADLGELETAKPYEMYDGNSEQLSLDLPRLFGELVGSGSFVTTADDMTRWMNFHLSAGLNWRGLRVMKEEQVHELHKPRMAMPRPAMPLFVQPQVPVTTSFDMYALGWWTGYYRGFPIVGHSGASYGYRSFVVLVPHLKAGVFMALNGDDESYAYRGPLLNLLLDHLLETPSWVDTAILCTFPSPWHNVSQAKRPLTDTRQPLAHNVSAYLGVYESPDYGKIEIKLADEVDSSRSSRRGVRGSVGWAPGSRTDVRDEGPEPSRRRLKHQAAHPQLTLLYGFARWDLVPLAPRHAAFRVSSSDNFNEHFYGVGRGVTAFVDYYDFIFHPPTAGSDVITKLSAPGLENRIPPVFHRVVPGRSGATKSVLQAHSLTLQHMFLAVVSSIVLKCR